MPILLISLGRALLNLLLLEGNLFRLWLVLSAAVLQCFEEDVLGLVRIDQNVGRFLLWPS